MSFTTEAHSQWHRLHGAYAVCPLDCGVEEFAEEPHRPATQHVTSIHCGHCKGYHSSIAEVRACSTVR
jgi:hypothetical protein